MKKFSALILAIIMLAVFAACGGESEETTAKGSYSLSDILSGKADASFVYGKMSAADKATLISEAKKEGVEVSFGSDGSMTVKDTDGSVITQHPDGSWTFRGEDGSEGSLGGGWQDNELSRMLPKPDITVAVMAAEGGMLSVAFGTDTTLSDIRAYAEKLKSAGFNIDAELSDESVFGITVYAYTAKNSAGYIVSLSYASGTAGLTLEKAT